MSLFLFKNTHIILRYIFLRYINKYEKWKCARFVSFDLVYFAVFVINRAFLATSHANC